MIRALVLALLALAMTAAPAGAEPRSLTLLSDGPFTYGGMATYAELAGVSDDGARLFVATSAALVQGDTDDGGKDVYLLTPSGYVPVTVNQASPVLDQEASFHTVSGDGSVAVFTSVERLLASDTDASHDVYAWSITGALVHISDNPIGADGDEAAFFAHLSLDGSAIVFVTTERLAASDTDDEIDLYRRTLGGGLVHLSDGGQDLNIPVHYEGADPGAQRVFFESAERLVAGDGDDATDVYEHGPAGLRLLSGGDEFAAANFGGATPDGTRVYFEIAESLASTDTDTKLDVYERTATGELTHVSDAPAGSNGPHDVRFLGAAADASRIWLETRERLAASDTDVRFDVYERGPAGALVHLSRNPSGTEGDYDAGVAGWTPDGSRVYLDTDEPLLASDTDEVIDLYERDATGALRHISDDPTGPDANRGAHFTHVSADGRRVLFETVESLAASDTDADGDVYERTESDLIAVSDGPAVPDAEINATFAAASRDGTRVYLNVFDQLLAADTDDNRDVYLSTVTPTPPAPGGPPGGGGAADTARPRITGVKVVRGRLRFTLSERARVRIVVRRGPRAIVVRSLDRAAGRHRVALGRRVRRTGRYRLAITAVDPSGNRSLPRRVRFRAR